MAKIEKPEGKDQNVDKSSKKSNKSTYSKKKKIKLWCHQLLLEIMENL